MRRRHAPPTTPYYNIDASRLNIDIHWCAVPVENYDGTSSVTRAAQVTIADRARPERVGHHHIDMARARLLHGNRENVLTELNAARRWDPERLRLRLYSIAGRLARHARQTRLRLAAHAPHTELITTGLSRMKELPAPY